MKKKTIFILSIIIMIALSGGLFMEKKKNDKLNMDIQKKRIEKYIEYNYKDIECITFTDSKKVPTGGTYINGYVNNDEAINFAGWLTPDKFEAQFSSSQELEKLAKYEKNKNIEDIENEEKKTSSTAKVYQPNWFNDKYNG